MALVLLISKQGLYMIYKILIPVIVFSVMSLTLIKTVTNSNQVEYIDHYKDIPDSVVSNNRATPISYTKSSKTKKHAFTFKAPKRYVKPQPKLAAPNEAPKVAAKPADKKAKPKLAKTVVAKPIKKKKQNKEKKREPSQLTDKQAKENAYKFSVPEEMPKVTQPIFSTNGIISSNQFNNTAPAPTVSSGNVTSPTPSNNIESPSPVDPIVNIIDPIGTQIQIESLLLNESAKESLNQQYNSVFNSLSNHLGLRVKAELQQAIQEQADEDDNLEIIEFKDFSVNFQNQAPGLNTYGKDTLILSLPQQGRWEMSQIVRVHYDNNIFETTEDITIKIKNLSLNFPFKLVHDQSGRIYIYEALNPIYGYDVSFESTSFLTNVLFNLYNLFMPSYLNQAITQSVVSLGMDVKSLVNKTKLPVQNINGAYTEVAPNDLDQIIENIDAKIQAKHLYHGTVHALKMKTAGSESWKETYGSQGSGLTAQTDKVTSLDDAARLSGHYLASLAFKYQVNPTAANLTSISTAIAGIERLFKVNTLTGKLARSVHRLDSPVAQDLLAQNYTVGKEVNIKNIDGVDWLGFQGAQGITRDQYSGVLLGLTTAWEKVNDPQLKTKCETLVKNMIQYLEVNNWIFEKDLIALATPFQTQTPNIWRGANHYKIAYYAVAAKMMPNLYTEKLDDLTDLTYSAWLAMFFETIDPIKDYKRFHTYFTELYTYFMVDTDSERRQQMEKVVRHLDFYLGHHRNVFFDSVVSSILPGKLSQKINNIKVGLYKHLNRPHRLVRGSGIDLNTIVTATTELPTGETVTIANEALHPEYRELSSGNVWDKSAHTFDTNEQSDNLIESTGIDATLPYWMAKAHQFY